MEKISNWGFFPEIEAKVSRTTNSDAISELISNNDRLIARGNGRCYGDSSLQKTIVSTLKLNKFISFDKKNGILECESGLLLSDILEVIVPKGFFLPVTPGTKFITIGGAVASNIHGKNHHLEGAISKYIISLEIYDQDGTKRTCSRENDPELFSATIGGMGLTGIISSVKFKLKKIETAYITQKAIKTKNVHELLDLFEHHKEDTYSVAWIDCLSTGKRMGRSILMLGEHAEMKHLPNKLKNSFLKPHDNSQINIPFKFPSFVLNSLTIRIFNFLYYHKNIKKIQNNILHYDKYFYPLDSLKNWNRIYGKNGFTQYQFVIPFDKGREGMIEILDKISQSGQGSFLAVLKTFGPVDEDSSVLTFPTAGYTLALDFKLSPKVLELLDELDKIVLQYGGKLYLSKDSRMSAEMMNKTYDLAAITKNNKSNKFSSIQSERLGIHHI